MKEINLATTIMKNILNIKNDYYIIVSRAAVIILQLASIKLLTEYLSTEEIGLYFFLISASYFLNALIFIPLDYYQQAFVSNAENKNSTIKSALLFNKSISAIYIIISSSIGLILYFSIETKHFILFGFGALGSIALHYMQSLRNLLNNLGYSLPVSTSHILEATSRVGIFFGLGIANIATIETIAFSWASSLCLTSLFLIRISVKNGIFNGYSDKPLSPTEFFKFATPISLSSVANWLQVQGYRVVLVPLGYAEVVGIFSTISNIGSSAIGALNLIYQQKFNPRIYQSQGNYTKRYLGIAFLLILTAALAFTLTGELIVKALTTVNFHEYWYVILYGLIADSSNLIVGALIIHLTIKKTTGSILIFSMVGLLVNAIAFTALYALGSITVNLIGLPILLSQWTVAILLLLQFHSKT
jgi:O-antigen/teichoic acid export membrane protein